MNEKSYNVEKETRGREAFFFCEPTEKFYWKQTQMCPTHLLKKLHNSPHSYTNMS